MPAERGETVGNKPRMGGEGRGGGGGTGARRLRVKAAAVWTGAFKAPPLCFPLSANTENVPLPTQSLATAAPEPLALWRAPSCHLTLLKLR